MKTKKDEKYYEGYNCATVNALVFLDRLFQRYPMISAVSWNEDFSKDFLKAMSK